MEITHPASSGRDSIHTSRPSPATPSPPRRFSAPATTSEVMGDFHEPYGAVTFPAPPPPAAEPPTSAEAEGENEDDDIGLQGRFLSPFCGSPRFPRQRKRERTGRGNAAYGRGVHLSAAHPAITEG